MAKNIFRDLKPQTKLHKNGFDCGRLRNFTAKIGELLPILSLETVPGGHYEISPQDLLRTIPMNNAAFLRAKQHFEFYFVPYKQLWSQWDNFYTTRQVQTSTLIGQKTLNAVPNAKLQDILEAAWAYKSRRQNGDRYGDLDEFLGYGMDKIANLLGYRGSYGLTMDNVHVYKQFADVKPNLFRAAAYQKICFDYYRQPYFDLPDDRCVFAYNLDDANSNGSITTEFDDHVNRLTYLFQMHYRQWKKDMFTGVLPSTQFGAVSVVNTGQAGGALTAIDIDNISWSDLASINGYTDRTRLDSFVLDDGVVPDSGRSVTAAGDGFSSSGQLLVQNGSGVYTQGTVTNSGQVVDPALESDHYHSLRSASVSLPDGLSGAADIASVNGSFDVLTLVKAQAIQRWREITLRSGYRNTSQYEGHFGVTPIFTEKDKCVFIDAVSSPLQVNAVTNVSAQGAVALGDLAANGTSVLGGKTIKFDAKDFGVIMCIYSILPEVTYNSFNLDAMNIKIERDDFFTPEFENIGLQPVQEVTLRLNPEAEETEESPTRNRELGFVPRYAEYKVGIDQQTAEFDDSGVYQSAFQGWSPQRNVLADDDHALLVQDFYCSPLYYKDIFVVLPAPVDDPKSFGNSATDTFLHHCYFDIKAVLPMSVLGLPNY